MKKIPVTGEQGDSDQPHCGLHAEVITPASTKRKLQETVVIVL